MALRLAFLGTAAFAVPALKAVHGAGHEIALVLSQPDRPRGRGQQLQPTPLKLAAQELGLPVEQPEKARDAAVLERLAALRLDALAVVAYGQILPQALLDLPRLGCVNLHASLLPRWRGAAPIEWAIAEGDAETGVCTQRMLLKLDAGPVLGSRATAIAPDEDAAALTARLALLGADLLAETLSSLAAGGLAPEPQDEARATYARLLTRADGWADWALDAAALERRCRAFSQRPGFHARLAGAAEGLKLHRLAVDAAGPAEPGTVLEASQAGIKVACAGGAVRILRLQPPGGRVMEAAEFLRGHALAPGARFDTIPPTH
jgi:methionyl-tRNA formyltransferase